MNAVRYRMTEMATRWYSYVFTVSEATEDERTGLLNRTFHLTYCDRLWILILGVVLVLGVSLSAYLLAEEEKSVDPKFSFVPRNGWNSQPSCVNAPAVSLPVQKILLLPTNTSYCWNNSDCLKIVRDLRKEHIVKLDEKDILYNFVVTGNGQIYEGRGWNCLSSIKNNGLAILTIAFLGKYDDQAPTAVQVQRLEAYIEDAIMQKYLSSCYQIFVRGSKFINDVASKLEPRENKIC